MNKSIEERYEDFVEWTTFVEDRFNDWIKTTSELKEKLNWKPDSLSIIENYLLTNFSIEDLKSHENKYPIDAIVSYIGGTIRMNIPETIWKIDLEDQTNLFYNLPYLVFKLGAPTCPHNLVKECLTTGNSGMIKARFDYHLKKWNQYQSYLRSQESNDTQQML